MQAEMRCRMFRLFSRGAVSSLTCFGLSSWQQKCIGPSGSCTVPPRKQGRPASKAIHKRWHRLRASWAPRRLLLAPEHVSSIAARSPEQPWPIRLVCAGQAHWPLCFEPAAYTLRRHRGEWREVVVCDVRRARARRHDGHLECIASTKSKQ